MSYFVSKQAELKAKRIAQLLAAKGQTAIAAQRDGQVIMDWQGHMHLFSLDERYNLVLVRSANAIASEPVVTII